MGFFDRVLPTKGPYSLLSGSTGPDGKLAEQRQWDGLKSIAELEKKVQQLSLQPLNIFFAVGSYNGRRNSANAVAKRALYLDLDEKKFDGSLRDALIALDTFMRTVGLPPHSILVHSGHGLHVYWCLDRDVSIAEWEPVAEALEAKFDELNFPADHITADAARVLRVPGTLNIKGEPIPCRIVSNVQDRVYPLERFASLLGCSPQSPKSKLSALAPADALITKAPARPLSADEVAAMLDTIKLQPGARDRWLEILCAVQDWCGKSEEGWGLFHEWCKTQPDYSSPAGVRKEWDSFDPGRGISVGTLVHYATEAGYVPPGTPTPAAPAGSSFAEQVAAGVGAVAPEEEQQPEAVKRAIASNTLLMSAYHAVVAAGGPRFNKQDAVTYLSNEFVIVTDQPRGLYSKTARRLLDKTTIDDLLTRYVPLNKNARPDREPTKIIRDCGTTHDADSLGFHPAEQLIYREMGKTFVNQYTAPADMIPGTPAEVALIERFLDHVFPPGDKEAQVFKQYLMECFGSLVQQPAVKIQSAPLLISQKQGTGKTTLVYDIASRLVGVQNAQQVETKTLRGSFSSYLNGNHLVYFDEIRVNGRWDSNDIANALKPVIAGSVIEIHEKFMSPFNIVNRVFVTATSNFEDAMALENDSDRRWAVYAVPEEWLGGSHANHKAFFKAFHTWLQGPRAAGVLRWYFSQIDISQFNPALPPQITAAKRNMVLSAQHPAVRCIRYAMENGRAPFDKDLFTNDEVQQYLASELNKFPEYQVREFIKKADRNIVALPKTRLGILGNRRPLAWRNVDKWAMATDEEIRKEFRR